MPISPDHLAIYFNAGVAATAVHFEIGVKRVSLMLRNQRRDRPLLAPMDELAEIRRSANRNVRQAYVDYATVLLAGSAGRWLGLERHLAYPRPHADLVRLEQAHLAEAQLCAEPETDRAFAIILARLSDVDDGDAATTFKGLWRRANLVLRRPPCSNHLDRIVDAIRKRRVLDGREVLEIVKA